MKIINWIVEKNIFDNESELVNIIRSKENCKVNLVDDSFYDFDFDNKIKNKYTIDDIVIFYGSFQLGRRILRDTSFIPALFSGIILCQIHQLH
jgi:hypothetical protein